MKPSLKAVHSLDLDEVETFAPSDGEPFTVLLQLRIGPVGREGQESFDVVVCTGSWIAERASESEVLSLRHHLVVHRYHWEQIRRFVEAYLETIEGDSWRWVAERVGRLGRWESEDYDVTEQMGTGPWLTDAGVRELS